MRKGTLRFLRRPLPTNGSGAGDGEVEPLLWATSTIEIYATTPLSDVVDELERLA